MNRREILWMSGALSVSALTAGCKPQAQAANLDARRYGSWGFDVAGMDKTVAPGDDFFRYSAGKQFDALKIPGDRASWGPAEELTELSIARQRAIIDEATNAWLPRGLQAQVAGLYKGFMNKEKIEELGAKPLEADLAKIRAADTHEKLAALMGEGQGCFFGMLFAPFIGIDQKAPDRYVVYINSSGLGLPERDYYLDPRFAEDKAAYRGYVAQLLTLAGWPEAEKNADAILALETRVAQATWPIAERRDDDKMYNAKSPDELRALAPDFPWTEFLTGAQLNGQPKFVVGEHTSFGPLAAIYAETDAPTLQAWQAFNLADQSSRFLTEAFVNARFEFRLKKLNGVKELRSRDKRGVQAVEEALGEPVGRLYVAKYFPAESKAKMNDLVANLKSALRTRLHGSTWMAPATKTEALKKLDTMMVKIGYPDKWRDYSGLRIDPADLYGNMRRSITFEWDYSRGKLGKPIDRLEWGMTPQTVNAYFNSTLNEIVFPAAILQPPYFDPAGDPAVNYGSIGATIGHEITHGFDDQGRKSDATGLLRNWWTPEDEARYTAQSKVLGAQFALFEPVKGHKINAELTMGENIADLGGLLIALDAYHASLGGKPAPVLDGMTGDQRFFLAYSQSWLNRKNDEALIQQLASDPHSPDDFRVNGPLPNVDEWYAAFSIQPGAKMYIAPEKRAQMW